MAARVISRISTSGHLFRAAARREPLTGLSNGLLSQRASAASSPIKINWWLRDLRNYVWSNHWFSSSASPQPTEKESNQAVGHDNSSQDDSEVGTNTDSAKINGDSVTPEGFPSEPTQSEPPHTKKRRRVAKRTAFSDSDSECDLSFDDLVKLVAEKEELLKLKHKEIESMQEKVLRSYAEMENVTDRTKREAENSKKFAIQNFAKGLLDVADNLGRASSVVKDSFSKIDSSKDSVGAVPLIKTLLDGVEMTEKQLAEVFRKFGLEKFNPVNEHFDPNRHHALFQVPDASKPPGTVAAVLKTHFYRDNSVHEAPATAGCTQPYMYLGVSDYAALHLHVGEFISGFKHVTSMSQGSNLIIVPGSPSNLFMCTDILQIMYSVCIIFLLYLFISPTWDNYRNL